MTQLSGRARSFNPFFRTWFLPVREARPNPSQARQSSVFGGQRLRQPARPDRDVNHMIAPEYATQRRCRQGRQYRYFSA
ncbi:MAG TPA: hypothetical protein VFW75_09830 [Acetobacteraceae bacterium]|nr:hypothetical protein [Acetobacteraceae bacterium]